MDATEGLSGSPLLSVNLFTNTFDVLGILSSVPKGGSWPTFTRITAENADWINRVVALGGNNATDYPDLVDWREYYLNGDGNIVEKPGIFPPEEVIVAGLGDQILLRPGVANVGLKDATRDFNIAFYASLNETISESDRFLGKTRVTKTVPKLGDKLWSNAFSQDFLATIPTTLDTDKEYYIGWIFDADDEVDEYIGYSEYASGDQGVRDTNNTGATRRALVLGRRDLIPDGISVPGNAVVMGQPLNVSFAVINNPTSDGVALDRGFDVSFFISKTDSTVERPLGKARISSIGSTGSASISSVGTCLPHA